MALRLTMASVNKKRNIRQGNRQIWLLWRNYRSKGEAVLTSLPLLFRAATTVAMFETRVTSEAVISPVFFVMIATWSVMSSTVSCVISTCKYVWQTQSQRLSKNQPNFECILCQLLKCDSDVLGNPNMLAMDVAP